jgi:hypothetical protein
MTPLSIAIGLAVALLTGLAGGWLIRERATGTHWSFAVAAAIGLLLFQTSSVGELFGNLIPASALGWVPWIALSVAGVQMIAYRKVRIVCALVLGFAIPLRLLWGSVYLGEANPGPAVLTAIAAWSLAIGLAISINKPAANGRFSLQVFGWALLIASSTCVIAATGSITYAVAIGVIGVAIVGNLLGASRLPLQSAAVVICVIGLSVAFSEMPLPLGVLLIASALAVSYLGQDGAPSVKWGKSIQVAAHVALVCVAVFAISNVVAPSDEYGGYESDAGSVVDDLGSAQQTSLSDGPTRRPPSDATDEEAMPDPFAGFEP